MYGWNDMVSDIVLKHNSDNIGVDTGHSSSASNINGLIIQSLTSLLCMFLKVHNKNLNDINELLLISGGVTMILWIEVCMYAYVCFNVCAYMFNSLIF